ncbi:MAG: hypothetical protein WA061_02215 [Microgenomates group bacterium]
MSIQPGAITSQQRNNERRQNPLLRPKFMVKSKEVTEEKRKRLIRWAIFYRRNTHRFVEHYLGIKLYPYQKLWIYMMGIKDSMVSVAARSSAKTWLIGVYAVARCILYPNSSVVIVSSTLAQAAIILSEKIRGLINDYPAVAREIESITVGQNKNEAIFYNGSTIRVCASRDSARGARATFIIVEESRLVNLDILNSVIRPFAFVRPTPYSKLKKYSYLPPEEPKEMHITSAHYSSGWWYKEMLVAIKNMLQGKNVGFFATDYLTAIFHKIKTKAVIEKDREVMDEITFQHEYLNLSSGESSSSYFKNKMFQKNRSMKKSFYPLRPEEYANKNQKSSLPKKEGEIRVVSVDIATRAGKQNDNSILSCFRLFPTTKGYEKEVPYMESHSGSNTGIQALRVKQLFYEFEADYIVLDVANAGISVYDSLTSITHDLEKGIEYPAMTCMIHPSISEKMYDDLKNRTIGLNALPVIYPIYGSSQLNSDIAVQMRNSLQRKTITFLVGENDAEDYLSKNIKGYLDAEDSETRANALSPFVETGLFVYESINLSMTIVSGLIKLSEPPGNRKDRYTSVSYGNYFISILEQDLLKESEPNDLEDWLNSTVTC